MEILDGYVASGPDRQSVLDIFAGEWSSQMPVDSGLVSTPGSAELFEDGRIDWLSQIVGGFEGKKILELGPLEAGHTYMMHAAGAGSITAVEANTRSYLKCLCIQQVFELERARFVFADALSYTEQCDETFDLCLCSGLLYHMVSPIALIRDICLRANTVFIWTHYYEPSLHKANEFIPEFEPPRPIEFEGESYMVARRHYREALNWSGFCGGSKPWAYWLTRDSLEKAIAVQGFEIVDTGFEGVDNINGPSVALVARRR